MGQRGTVPAIDTVWDEKRDCSYFSTTTFDSTQRPNHVPECTRQMYTMTHIRKVLGCVSSMVIVGVVRNSSCSESLQFIE